MMRHVSLALRATLIALLLAPLLLGGASAQPPATVDWTEHPVRLLMVEQRGCIYCAQWDREIGPGYPRSDEGRRAPLLRVDLHGPWPDGLVLDRRPTITPTFILLHHGREVSRLEGYAGDQFFYPLLDAMLRDMTPQQTTREEVE